MFRERRTAVSRPNIAKEIDAAVRLASTVSAGHWGFNEMYTIFMLELHIFS